MGQLYHNEFRDTVAWKHLRFSHKTSGKRCLQSRLPIRGWEKTKLDAFVFVKDDFYTDVTVIERMLAFPTLKREYHVLKQEPGAAQKQMKQLMITVRSLTEVILEINP